MGWSIGYSPRWKRDVGYGVPATCDHPGCGAEIDRGLSYVCGGMHGGGDHGCGLYFCSAHLQTAGASRDHAQVCTRCYRGRPPFLPTADRQEWIFHKLTDPSWQTWRERNAAAVAQMRIANDVHLPAEPPREPHPPTASPG